MLRILYAEDDENLRESVSAMLRILLHNVEVTPCAHGDEAWDLLNAKPHYFKVLVTDNNMWGGMDGAELAKRLRADTRFDHLPIIMVSGAALPEDLKGKCHYLNKSNIADLQDFIISILRNQVSL